MENFKKYLGFQTRRFDDLCKLPANQATWSTPDKNCLNRL